MEARKNERKKARKKEKGVTDDAIVTVSHSLISF